MEVTLAQATPYYVQEGDTIALECVLNHTAFDHSQLTIGLKKDDDRTILYVSPTSNDAEHVISENGEIVVVGQTRYIFRLNATLDASGVYYCYYD